MIENTNLSKILSILSLPNKPETSPAEDKAYIELLISLSEGIKLSKRFLSHSYLKFFQKNTYPHNIYNVQKNKMNKKKKNVAYLIASFYSSQPRFSVCNYNFKILSSLTGRKSLLESSIFKKSLKKSFKAYRALMQELDKLLREFSSLILHLNKLRMPLKKFLGLFYNFSRGKFIKKKLTLMYIIISPKQSYCLTKKKRLRRIKKRLRKRTLKTFKQIPY